MRPGILRNLRTLFGRLLFAGCVAAFTLPEQAHAGDGPPLSVDDFQRTTFTAKEGAPELIASISQTADGWLWFGGSTGLARFDGVAFEKFDVGTADGRLSAGVSTLYALPSGGLLIGHLSGGMTIYRRGVLTRHDNEEMFAAGRLVDAVADRDGTIWAVFEKSLMRLDGDLWNRVELGQDFKVGFQRQVDVDAGGAVWLHTPNRISRLARGQKTFEVIAQVDEPGGLVKAQDGGFLFLAMSRDYPDRRWTGQERDPSEPSRKSNPAYVDGKGYLWSNVLASPSRQMKVAGFDQFGPIPAVLEDQEKNIWLAELGKLHRLRPSPVVRVLDAQKIAGGKTDPTWIHLSSDKEGTIWFTKASAAGSVARQVDRLWSVKDGARPSEVEAVGSATRVSADLNGSVWAAGASGLWEQQGGGFTKRAEFYEAGIEDKSLSMAAGCVGGLWAAVRGGNLHRFSNGVWQDQVGAMALPSAVPTTLYCDGGGNLWLGYGDGRVAKVDQALKTTLFPFSGGGLGTIGSISVGRHTLVGGSGGLAILSSKGFVRLSSMRPVLLGITGIVESPDGYVWLTGALGLIRIWSSDLENSTEPLSEIRTELFGADDGFPTPPYSLRYSTASIALDRDRRVWFSGLGGLAFIDSAKTPPASQSPRVVLKALTSGGRTLEGSGDLSLPGGTRNVEIAYTALGAAHADRLRFRYRLDGVDDGWVNVDDRRRAVYTNLPPGAHRFQVDAADEFGSWLDRPVTLRFSIQPTFLQSWVFKGLCILTGTCLLAIAYRLRIRSRDRRQQRLFVERLDERERIARELHDTLLQGTQALILKVHSASKLASQDEPIHQALDKALDQATNVMVEARNRIEDLRHRPSANDDVAALLVQFGQDLMPGPSPQFKAFVEGSARDLAPEVLREACLIGREALLNGFHHAKANTIELQIEFTDEAFRLRVRDDGQGFDDQVLTRPRGGRHWGLPGMQERARAISGQVKVWTRPGLGTEVELRVPGEIAYVVTSSPSRWSKFRGAFQYRT